MAMSVAVTEVVCQMSQKPELHLRYLMMILPETRKVVEGLLCAEAQWESSELSSDKTWVVASQLLPCPVI